MEQTSTSEQTPTLKEKQRQERERLILSAAEEVLYEKGYHDTSSIDEIAARVGVAKGTVYLHSLSKEDLVFAVYLHNFATFVRAIDEVLSEALPSRQQLETILASMYGGFSIKQIQPLYNSINMKRFFEVSREQEGPRPWVQLAVRAASILEVGKVSGNFDAATPTSVQVATFFSLLSPRSYERVVLGEHMAFKTWSSA